MRERLPRCTYSFSHFPNIPIFSLPYSHILTLHSPNNGDLVLKLALFGSDPNGVVKVVGLEKIMVQYAA